MPKKTFQVSVIDILLFVNESLIKVLIFYRIFRLYFWADALICG